MKKYLFFTIMAMMLSTVINAQDWQWTSFGGRGESAPELNLLSSNVYKVDTADDVFEISFEITCSCWPPLGIFGIFTIFSDVGFDTRQIHISEQSSTFVVQLPNGNYTYILETENYDIIEGEFTVNGEPKTIEINLICNEGINDFNIPNILIYPNPTMGGLTITISSQVRNDVRDVEIFNILGKSVETNLRVCSKSNNIDISYLPAGMYFVKITTENGIIITKKIIKMSEL